MSATSFDLVIAIHRAPADVFACLVDVQRHAVRDASPVLAMRKEPPGETRVGTRWHETVRVAPWGRMTIVSEVTGLEPDRMLAMRFRGPWFEGALTYTLEADPGGCSLRQRERFEAPGPLGRIGGTMLRPRLVARLEDIRDRLEHDEAG